MDGIENADALQKKLELLDMSQNEWPLWPRTEALQKEVNFLF